MQAGAGGRCVCVRAGGGAGGWPHVHARSCFFWPSKMMKISGVSLTVKTLELPALWHKCYVTHYVF